MPISIPHRCIRLLKTFEETYPNPTFDDLKNLTRTIFGEAYKVYLNYMLKEKLVEINENAVVLNREKIELVRTALGIKNL